jgi:hypothetical protein
MILSSSKNHGINHSFFLRGNWFKNPENIEKTSTEIPGIPEIPELKKYLFFLI